jgi:hypothetical protein
MSAIKKGIWFHTSMLEKDHMYNMLEHVFSLFQNINQICALYKRNNIIMLQYNISTIKYVHYTLIFVCAVCISIPNNEGATVSLFVLQFMFSSVFLGIFVVSIDR